MVMPDKHTVLAWEAQRQQALLAGDLPALAALLSDALVYVHSTAVIDTKASYLAKLQSGAIRYISLAFEELTVHALGGAALVHGQLRATVRKEGTDKPVCSRFLTVWAPDGDGVWRLVAHQGTAQT